MNPRPSSRAYPVAVRFSIAVWVALCCAFFALASVPAVSPPWQSPAHVTPARFAFIEYWWPVMMAIAVGGLGLLSMPSSWDLQIRGWIGVRRLLREHRALCWLLLGASMLRFVLVMRGGQYFDWDEVRYGGSATWLFAYVSTGHFREAADLIARAPDHPGFRLVGLILAFFHVPAAWASGLPITEMRHATGEWLPAFLLSLSSVFCIGLVYAVAVRSGAKKQEAFLAAFFMATSTSMLMYARHFLPYDAAMATLLLALWLALDRSATFRHAFAFGLVCGVGFLTYEGYWLLTASICLFYLARRSSLTGPSVLRAACVAAGLLMFPLALGMLGLVVGRPFMQSVLQFSRSAVNGDFNEGWALPWLYLWHAEHLILIVYLVGIGWAAFHRRHAFAIRWVILIGVIYAAQVIGADVLHRFAVYDRLVRQMLPFCCLAAAAGYSSLDRRWLSGLPAAGLYAGLSVLFVLNAAPFFAQRYPRDVAQDVVRQYGAENVALASTVAHADPATIPIFIPVDNAPGPPRRYVLLNAHDIWVPGGASEATPAPAGAVLLAVRHPRQLPSLQYHGYTPEERSFLRSTDISIRLIDTWTH